MDLALEMGGMTAAGMTNGMTERELSDWAIYRQRRMFPQRRLELLLAQISMLIAKTMGGAKDAKLADFLFDPIDEDDAAEGDDEQGAREFFGFAPRASAKKE